MAEVTTLEGAHGRYEADLAAALDPSGGMAWVDGGAVEPEPTAMAALALDDVGCRDWLSRNQAADGSVVLETGEVRNTGAAGLVALAMEPGDRQQRALDFAISATGGTVPDPQYAGDPPGWGWVPGTFAWVEPTARVLLATRILRADDSATIDDALVILRGRETEAGGWNYGNSSAKGTELTPYVQTTATALLAMAGLDEPSIGRAVEFLRVAAPRELGGLSLATTLLALRVAAAQETELADQVLQLLDAQYAKSRFLGNRATLAWAVLATGPLPSVLAVTS